MIDYLSRAEIIYINQATLQRHGGHFVAPENLLHGESLDYVLESVSGELFGEPLYPQLSDKAAVYMHAIICNHVFQDGNKRTGLEAAKLFVRLNGFDFSRELLPVRVDEGSIPDANLSRNDHLIQFTLAVAAGRVSLDACRGWFAANLTPTAR